MKRLAILGLSLVLGLLLGGGPPGAETPRADAAAGRPNIVLVLMDDFSLELLSTMRNVHRLQAVGATFDNAFVADSLCCPSRTALLTGRYPHQTGVLLNTPNSRTEPLGGYQAFRYHHNGARTFAVPLQRSGYTTGFIGKFLNQYEPRHDDGRLVPPPVPPGWDDWQVVFGGGYSGWGFLSSRLKDGRPVLRAHPKPPLSASVAVRDRSYAQHVIGRKAVAFVREHRDDDQPYFLEVAPYAPHASLTAAYKNDPRFPPAFRDRPSAANPGGNCGARRCSDLSLRDLPGYRDPRGDNAPTYLHRDGRTALAPAWNTAPVTLSDRDALRAYRNRARMVQSIDRMIGRLRQEVGPNTFIVITADNGIHLGQHRLNGGKGTAYDHDTRVPLVVAGPGVVPGPRSQYVGNVDLAPTIEDLAGLTPAAGRAGTSFAPSLANPQAPGGRYAFIEHTWARTRPGEADADRALDSPLGLVPSYVAVRGQQGLLIRYDLDNSWTGHRYAWELYRRDDPWQLHNVFASDHARPYARELRRHLAAFSGCASQECRAAAR